MSDQRPGRRHIAGAGRGANRIRRVRGNHQPRPVVSGSSGDYILAFEGDSHVEWFEGNFQAYEEDKRRRLGADVTEPHRIKDRPLAR